MRFLASVGPAGGACGVDTTGVRQSDASNMAADPRDGPSMTGLDKTTAASERLSNGERRKGKQDASMKGSHVEE